MSITNNLPFISQHTRLSPQIANMHSSPQRPKLSRQNS